MAISRSDLTYAQKRVPPDFTRLFGQDPGAAPIFSCNCLFFMNIFLVRRN